MKALAQALAGRVIVEGRAIHVPTDSWDSVTIGLYIRYLWLHTLVQDIYKPTRLTSKLSIRMKLV